MYRRKKIFQEKLELQPRNKFCKKINAIKIFLKKEKHLKLVFLVNSCREESMERSLIT